MPRPEFVLRRGRFHGVLRRGDRDRSRRGDWRAATRRRTHARDHVHVDVRGGDDARRRDVPASHARGDGTKKGGGGYGDGRGGGAVRVRVGHAGRVAVARVRLSESSRAVAALGFSPDGAALTTVGCDDNHTVHVWDWRARGVGEPRARAAAGSWASSVRAPGSKSDRRACTASSGIRARPPDASDSARGAKNTSRCGPRTQSRAAGPRAPCPSASTAWRISSPWSF